LKNFSFRKRVFGYIPTVEANALLYFDNKTTIDLPATVPIISSHCLKANRLSMENYG
jgi:hypothetical protein